MMPHNSSMKINTIYELIAGFNESAPYSECILSPWKPPLTYRELFNQVHYVANVLNSRGIHGVDRVATVIPNGPEMAAAFISIASCCTCAPLRTTYNEGDYEFYLRDLGAKALVIPQGYENPVKMVAERLGVEVLELVTTPSGASGVFQIISDKEPNADDYSGFSGPEDVALVLHTSGTTARPKIVPLTHSNLCTSAYNIANTLHLQGTDRCLNIMPLFHIHGLIGAVLSSLSAGACIVCTRGFNVNTFFEYLYDLKPTWYTAVPSMHHSILRYAEQGVVKDTGLRFIRSSSQALPPTTMKRMEALFRVPVIESYGMTEASHQMASNPLPPGTGKPGSVGVATGIDIGIMDDAGVLLSGGSVGEIVIRGPSVMSAYENNDAANKSSFMDGWFRTGDEGYLDDDGYLFVTGRIKEIINRGGEKISPREIDEVLMSFPEVAEALAFSIPHERLGETIGAVIVLEKDSVITGREIQRRVAERLDAIKVPEEILFLEEIPKGATGKVQRIGLSDKLGIREKRDFESTVMEAARPPKNRLEEQLVEIWSDVLKLPGVGVNHNYFQLGGDSILAASIIARMRETLSVKEISPVVFLHAPTIELMAELIQKDEIEKTVTSIRRLREGVGTPLLFIYPEDGPLDMVEALIKYMHAPNPIYGVESLDQEKDVTIEGLAESIYSVISAYFPDEKIHLVGVGAGGLVAIEIAENQLQNRGMEPLLLVNPIQTIEDIDRRGGIAKFIRSIIDRKHRKGNEARQWISQTASRYVIPIPKGATISLVSEERDGKVIWSTINGVKLVKTSISDSPEYLMSLVESLDKLLESS